MPRFAANLTMMFNEVPFLDRFAAASGAGFRGVEFLFPYEYPPEALEERIREYGLEIVLFNMPPGNWAAGERGIACIPGREEEFREGVDLALAYAARLGVRRLHAMAGIPPADADPQGCRAVLIANLKYAAPRLAERNITLLLEAINTRDMPGFFVSTQADSRAVCAAVGAPNLKMQLDLYHMQIMEGDLIDTIRANIDVIAHFHTGGVPGRHEIGPTQEIQYHAVMEAIAATGFQGFVAHEFLPTGDPLTSLRQAVEICAV